MTTLKRKERADFRRDTRGLGVRGRDFIKTPLTKLAYGDWEFKIRDPNGFILVFSELID